MDGNMYEEIYYELIYSIKARINGLEAVRRALDELVEDANMIEDLAYKTQMRVNDASIAELERVLEIIEELSDNNFTKEE